MPILPLLTTAPKLVLTIPKYLPASFCRAQLTIRCIGSRLVLGSGAPTSAAAADDSFDAGEPSRLERPACLEEVRGGIVPAC